MAFRYSLQLVRIISLVLPSYFVVAFGQPSWLSWCCPIAATVGYALFWKSLSFLSSSKQRFALSLFWYALVQIVQISWMTSVQYQSAWLLVFDAFLCLFLGLLFAIFCHFLWMQKEGSLRVLSMLALASFWTILEWSRLYIACGFSFNFVGMSLSAFSSSAQMISLFGILGLSFWVIFTNLLFLKTIGGRKEFTFRKRPAMAFCLFAILPFLFGEVRLHFLEKVGSSEQNEREIVVAILDTDLLPSEKVPIDEYISAFISPWKQWDDIIHSLPKKNEVKIDMLIMPEAVVPFGFDTCIYSLDGVKGIFYKSFGEDIVSCFPPLEMPFAAKKVGTQENWSVSNAFWMQTIANYYHSEIVAGLDYEDKVAQKNYNSAFHFMPNQNVQNRYDKQILVPLGEYLPFTWCEVIAEKYGITSFFSHGAGPMVFSGKVPLSISICYEETFSHVVRKGRQQGAQLFVSLSNDSWYPSSKLGRQHYDHGRLRALENGVSLIRSCNSGISAVIDGLGRTLIKSEGRTQLESKYKIILSSLKIKSFFTLYSFWGNSFIIGISFLFLGIFSYSRQKK